MERPLAPANMNEQVESMLDLIALALMDRFDTVRDLHAWQQQQSNDL